MKTISTNVTNQITLLELKISDLMSKVRKLTLDKTNMANEIADLKNKIEVLEANVTKLQEKSKLEENRRAAAEIVLQAAKHNTSVNDFMSSSELELVFLDN